MLHVRVSHTTILEVELYVPTYRGHKLSDVEFLIRSLLWSSRCAGKTRSDMSYCTLARLALFSDQALEVGQRDTMS